MIVCFAYIYTFHFLRLKQKFDSLLFLIKKHNNNKPVGYNAYIMFINKKRIRWGMAYNSYYIPTNKLQNV